MEHRLLFRGKPVRTSLLNPRIETERDDIEALAKAIRTTGGLVQRIVLRDKGEYWEIIVGSRRAQALARLRYSSIPAEYVKVTELSDADASELIVAEALSSVQLSPIEKGKVFEQLMQKYPTKYPVQEVLSKRLGISQEMISRYIGLYKDYALAHKQDPNICEYVNIVDIKKEPKQLSASTFGEISAQFRDQPAIMVEVVKEAARRGLTRSKIRALRNILGTRPDVSVAEVLDGIRSIEEEKGKRKQSASTSKSVPLKEKSTKELAIGIELGLREVIVCLGNEKGQILAKLTEKIDDDFAEEIVKQITSMVLSIGTQRLGKRRIQGIGMGCRGLLDRGRSGLLRPPDSRYVPLVEPLQNRFRVPVRIMNDCATAVVAEKTLGAGRDVENLVYVSLGEGIGGGVFVDNNLLMGKAGNAHEIGHLTIDYDSSRSLLCDCGKRGHWQAYCSGYGIPNYARSILKEKKPEELEDSLLVRAIGGKLERMTVNNIYNSARSGDPISREIIEGIAAINAVGIASVVHAYDPSLITIGGRLALNNTSLVIDRIRQQTERHALGRLPKIRKTPLGKDIVLVGALAIAFDRSDLWIQRMAA